MPQELSFNWEFSLGEGVKVVTEIVFISNFREIIKPFVRCFRQLPCLGMIAFLEIGKIIFLLQKFCFTAFVIKVSGCRARNKCAH